MYIRGTGWAVTRPSTGVYCVTPPAGLNPANTGIQLTVEWGNSFGFDLLAYWWKGGRRLAPRAQYHVRTYQFAAGGTPVLSDDVAFMIARRIKQDQ